MKLCHVCNFECEDNAELCPICGADLTNEEPEQEAEEVAEAVIAEPVLLAKFEDVVSAEIFKDILIENKIPYSCDEDDGGSMHVVFGGGFATADIYVDKTDFEKAEVLYNEFLESDVAFDGEFEEEFFETDYEEQ